MKTIIRSVLFNAVSFWIIIQLVGGFNLAKGYETLIVAALTLGLINLFVKPLLNILLMPINLITLGAFRWVANVIALFLVTVIVPEFKVVAFTFPGFSIGEISLPAYTAVGLLALILNSFLLSIVVGFLHWLIK